MTFDPASWKREANTLRRELLTTDQVSLGRWNDQHVEYGELIERLWALLKTANITVIPTDNIGWVQSCDVRPNDPTWYRSADVEDIAMASTHLQRAERHFSGAWLTSLENGVFPALIERLEVLADELPYDAARSPWTNRNYL
ncbi:DUF6508 domain-containing protein [Hansschlegelia zhihuaiae]|uniref:Uncharacterized protein n=1 Tax=Hansschlegelia zhihuaiae TaxID=405005 RepID=A0A4Q0MHF5_9HYPH|nr:DUF6508 domain-containing protein [Hansschlegelia zhihuaiae]RXF73011.1 hypothetical protein EK403_12815 [Hansschlegelia zhihuaiae]